MLEIKFSKKHKDIFQEIGISVLYLFGSYAQGNAHKLSDIDIGVVFSSPEKYKDKTMDAYLKLYDIFTDVLPKEYLKRRFKTRKHDFDLVFLQFAPLELQYNVLKQNKIIYQSNDNIEANYRENILKKYIDFSYFLNMRHQAALDRI